MVNKRPVSLYFPKVFGIVIPAVSVYLACFARYSVGDNSLQRLNALEKV